MSVESSQALERSVLDRKDREELLTIAAALGIKTPSRAKKADIVDRILQQTGVLPLEPSAPVPSPAAAPAPSEPAAEGEAGRAGAPVAATPAGPASAARQQPGAARSRAEARPNGDRTAVRPAPGTIDAIVPVVAPPEEEPPAEWEVAVGGDEGAEAVAAPRPARTMGEGTEGEGTDEDEGDDGAQRGADQGGQGGQVWTEGHPGEGRSRRRRRGRDRDRRGRDEAGPQRESNQGGAQRDRELEPRGDEPVSQELVEVSGHLDLRDEGYGFLRVTGFLPSRDDVYVSVKQVRQYGLRRGDHLVGASRAASRNEKNPALLRIDSVNGDDPEKARFRPRFEELTPLFPDQRLRLEDRDDPLNMTARIIDLISPIGKGQRGLIVSPPKAGKTTVMKTIAKAIERNNPEVVLMVLLVDERPEEVTDMRRSIQGQVIASTFDRPSDEHTMVAELTIERAKRLVEMGKDVVIILDGITRLARAYNLSAPATGRIMSGGIDTGALYPPKKFFGAARNIEEGGSLTILATALVDTGSRMDEVIFEEFKGTGNMELRLDRKVAERRIYPAIDVDASSTRHEELLFDRKQLQQVWKLR
ncbi:MAG: transcription termination factor Rho, partial [Actinobacteria bacterium]